MSKKVYCGNNRNSPELKKKSIGTRYECFKKGFGVGYHLPYDPRYKEPFSPIDKRKLYCGNKSTLPSGYHIMGSNPMCLQKGVSIGKKSRANKQGKKRLLRKSK